MQGKLITFEGIDGAGKSSQIELTQNFLKTINKKTIVTREPGGTSFGEKLRSLILDSDHLLSETEVLLMFAARLEHLHKVVFPALNDGTMVLCDRFTDSTYAYQGGNGVGFNKIKTMEDWVHLNFKPDLTFYFKVPVEVAIQRIKSTRGFDKFEQLRTNKLHEIKKIYERRATLEPNRFVIIDGNNTIEEVNKTIVEALTAFFTKL